MQYLSLAIFLLGYIAISQEHIIKISKTSISLMVAVLLWLLIAVTSKSELQPLLVEAGGEIFQLVIFLLSAMTLVEVLAHYGLFNYVYQKLAAMKLNDRGQFYILVLLTFIFSSVLDNLTVTIVFLQISHKLFSGKNLIKASSAIVIAANAGGVFSPIGDVTTTMLWLAGKFSTSEIVFQGFLPSLAMLLVSMFLIGGTIAADTKDRKVEKMEIGRIQWLIIGISLAAFLLPLFMTLVNLPPYFGLLAGLGVVWFIVDTAKIRSANSETLTASIEKFLQKTDISSLYFFIGILLSISALGELGILSELSRSVFSGQESQTRIIAGNIIIGGLSALFDNIPLTAAAIKIIQTNDPQLWVLLALTAGVGGSLLLIGSASGIIAMSSVKELNFKSYLKTATFPALVAYIVGIVVWFIQYSFF